jgi:hypothetical protein
MLFQRLLHPEFFKIINNKSVTRKAYDADIWMVDGGHVVSFTAGRNTLSEVIVCGHEGLNDRGLIQSIPCRGERNHELVHGGNIKYMISTQEEQLTQTLYEATRHEILAYARRRELPMYNAPATADSGSTLSVLDVEFRSHELLVNSFHLFDDNGVVIKTQGLFEVVKVAVK